MCSRKLQRGGWQCLHGFEFSTYMCSRLPVCLHFQGGTGNVTKPASAVCYLCSSAETVFLFFPQEKACAKSKRNAVVHPWKNLCGKQTNSTVNVMFSGNCQIMIPLQRHRCLIVPSNILLPRIWR